MKSEKQLARLGLRYLLSEIWAQSTVAHPEGEELMRQLREQGHLGPKEADEFLEFAKQKGHGVDQNTYIQHLAQVHKLTRDEVKRIMTMPHEKIAEHVTPNTLQRVVNKDPTLPERFPKLFRGIQPREQRMR